jgi:uncharacterized protein YpuA (DUF1002 family)
MQHLTVHIPDNKIDMFMDLAKRLGVTVENQLSKNILTDRQIELVDEARNAITNDPNVFLDWEDVRNDLNSD